MKRKNKEQHMNIILREQDRDFMLLLAKISNKSFSEVVGIMIMRSIDEMQQEQELKKLRKWPCNNLKLPVNLRLLHTWRYGHLKVTITVELG